MNPWVKRIAAALAIREGIERVQEMRQPKKSFLQRMAKPLALGATAGGLFYLYRQGKLEPVVNQAKEMLGQETNGHGKHSMGAEGAWTAPAATTGDTTVGAASTTSNI